MVSVVLGIKVGSDFKSIAGKWLCNKNFGACNMITTAMCWSLWKMRNCLCFQDAAWTSMCALWVRVLVMIRSWKILVPLKSVTSF
jgi:hypothetical protein